MSLVTQSIPNLVNGVSQQPYALRLPSQCEEQVNGLCTVAKGLRKRPPTTRVGALLTQALATEAPPVYHLINRDLEQQFLARAITGRMRVFQLDGQQVGCVAQDANATSYLGFTNPESIRFLTVNDYTFVLNSEKTITMQDSNQPPRPFEALVFVKSGSYGKTYELVINGATRATYTAPDGSSAAHTASISTENIALELYNDLTGGSGITSTTAANPTSVTHITATEDYYEAVPTGEWGGSYDVLKTRTVYTAVQFQLPVGADPTNTQVLADGIPVGFYSIGGGFYRAEYGTRSAAPTMTGVKTTPAVMGVGGFTVFRVGPIIYIGSETNFTIKANDGLGGTGMTVVKDRVQKFSDLPAQAEFDGFTVEVQGDNTSNFDNYWVKFVKGAGGGAWKEALKPGVKLGLQPAYMPHTLVRSDETTTSTATITSGTTNLELSVANPLVMVGMRVEGTGVAGGNIVEAVSGSTVTLSKPATASSAGSTYTFYEDWSFRPAIWTERVVGDDESSPEPSFVGRTITDVFFYRNRLGFLSDEFVILSEAGAYFNFFPTTVVTTLDSDPIDVSVSHTRVSLLKNAVTVADTLLLFADRTQFTVEPVEILSAKTINIKVATEFRNDTGVKPVVLGRNTYFVMPKGDWTSIREFFVDTQSNTKDAVDVTAHVPEYIPKNIDFMVGASNDDTLFAVSAEQQHRVYVYRYYWSGNEKLQSAWSYWSLGDSEAESYIEGLFVVDSNVYFCIKRSDARYLERMSLSLGDKGALEPYNVHLDRKFTHPSGSASYNPVTGYTTLTATVGLEAVGTWMAVLTNNAVPPLKPGVIAVIDYNGGTPRIRGDYSGQEMTIGRAYTFDYTFSTLTIKTGSEGVVKSEQGGRLQIRRMSIDYSVSGFFDTRVSAVGKDTYTYTFSGHRLSTDSSILGEIDLDTKRFSFPVLSKNTECTVAVSSDMPLPLSLLTAEWEGFFYKRSRSI